MAIKTKERPILFSGPMVRAILEGRKTQTRRVIKPKHEFIVDDGHDGTNRIYHPCYVTGEPEPEEIPCPYGSVGERLWVRETWVDMGASWDGDDEMVPARCVYRADGELIEHFPEDYMHARWTPSIHMPRWASRITLEITAVRVERLNDISEADALAEGCNGNCQIGYIPAYQAGPYSYHYAQLWESINGPGSWALNPWVWVIEFKPVK